MSPVFGIAKKPSGQEFRCPKCAGRKIIRKGFQKNKLGKVQIFYCKPCKKRFISRLLKNKTYDAVIVGTALRFHNLGHSLSKTREFINQKFMLRVSKSTIHNWVMEFRGLDINKAKKKKDHDEIVSKKFKHNDVSYNFKYHKIKLFSCKHNNLISYITKFRQGCPDFFKAIEKRCSTSREVLVDAHIFKAKDASSKSAKLALSSSTRNSDRHPHVENFMLLNDDSTIAVEVPVWLYEKNLGTSISGHIDLLQVRSDKIYILDYKPGAAKIKNGNVAGQLYLYARGLSFRTNLPLTCFRCAWFDENDYFEFNPAKARVSFQASDGRIYENKYTTIPKK